MVVVYCLQRRQRQALLVCYFVGGWYPCQNGAAGPEFATVLDFRDEEELLPPRVEAMDICRERGGLPPPETECSWVVGRRPERNPVGIKGCSGETPVFGC